MTASDPSAIPVAKTVAFLLDFLPPLPARVLDVGCGRGQLLYHLLEAGYEAHGIDSDVDVVAEAIEQGLPVVEADFLTFEGGGYDAVFFGRSLHHLQPLEDAVRRARELLTNDGIVIAEEFAVDAMDSATATWFYDLASVLEAAGLLGPGSEHARPDVNEPMERWRAEHDDDPPLSTGKAMVDQLGRHFKLEVSDGPYLYRDFCARLEKSVRGHEVAQRVLERETAGLGAGTIAPIGLRIVGRVND